MSTEEKRGLIWKSCFDKGLAGCRERNADPWSVLERRVWVWHPPRAGRRGWVHPPCSAWRCHFSFSPVPLLTRVSSKFGASLKLTTLSPLLRCSQAVEEEDSTVLGKRERHHVSIIYGNLHLAGKTLLGLNVREERCACYSVSTCCPTNCQGTVFCLSTFIISF